MTVQESNKLIAEFMGLDVLYDTHVHHKTAEPGKVTSMKYSTSWDWLMPVVEKILKSEYLDLGYDTYKSEEAMFVKDALVDLDFNTLYAAVVEFIKKNKLT